MSVSGKDFHIDLGVEDAVNHTVLFRYLTAPAVCGLTFHRFGMASACLGVLGQFFEKTRGLGKGFRLAFGETLKVLRSLGGNGNLIFHSRCVSRKPLSPRLEASSYPRLVSAVVPLRRA